ncbi:ABC transporter ATP-binding protein [Ilumatobacter sp.]|uniref:ABC transporter ATP-binding protein n=1 Tax=Ilumatobacter sp. TaxID=1967498 RepID=UPI003750B2F9
MTDQQGLEVVNITAGYGRATVLHEVSLSVGQGEIVALLGANGAGKSTLVKAIAGALACRTGSILIDGVDITKMRAEKRARHGVVLVPEGRRLFQAMTVAENIEAGSCANKSGRDGRAAVDRLLELFPILKERWTQQAGLLSGGQQQMLALTRAVAGAPRYLLLDEPSLGLSPLLCEEVFAFIETIAAETGAGVLLVEQMAARALELSARTYILDGGSVVHAGTSSEVADSDAVTQAYLGA